MAAKFARDMLTLWSKLRDKVGLGTLTPVNGAKRSNVDNGFVSIWDVEAEYAAHFGIRLESRRSFDRGHSQPSNSLLQILSVLCTI